ncbi:hypothetical protein SIN8267_02694 [Sinobacterium norvegicum]|uniref:VWFA domain-containing protein n=1 Tax=Sinobacterium norvegicum TaxID=1641715 RepID=A0ABM9AIG3_9GAMM|nr:VWA domain-containing protein [Sinobacterium norvegicum]CAH0992561.1 hypothetical protein SIN8267_02694 [Sinobacterium norvegicum]
MIEFAHPWWLLILPLPYVISRFSPAYKTRRSGVRVSFFYRLATLLGEKPEQGAVQLQPSWWQRFALIFSWLMLVTAMTKPIVLGEVQQRELSGRDIMVVVDLSGSMAAEDFSQQQQQPLSRLAAVKTVLAEFSDNRPGDRLGLILFGDAPYLQAPFTADHQAWLDLLNETEVAMAGPSTHLGDAIGLTIQSFSDSKVKEKVAIVLTDGNDTDSLVPPLEAAKVAASYDVRIHMVAMGNPETVGENALDMTVIEQVAEITGGQSYLALSQQQLTQVYQAIAALEPEIYQSTSYRPKTSVHYLPLAFAFVIYLFAFVASTVIRLKKTAGEQHV